MSNASYWNMDIDNFGHVRPYQSEHGRWSKRKDFDTLAKRLQEAERLLSCAKQYELGPTLHSMIDTFLSKKETK